MVQRQLKNNFKEIGFQVDGKIINELSKQVSSHLFALGELMKNSYDAKATKINIVFDKKNKQLIVEDNGTGISEENFKSLLHIAKSGKEYGREFEFREGEKTITRYTQGSKGLGLFCAFKFGDLVTWDTMFEGGSYKITVNKAEIIKLSDISKIKIPLEAGNRVFQGTTITISFELDSEINYIYSFFLEGENSKKIVKYFYAEDMEVSINLINKDGNSA
ncbi:ATP-binding protein [Ignatzschineria larvae DSM 13226]|uniref:ATP-binding protein n=1 Tax=Ignatzschineria larvae DSM 13226 TaxID=1111732 RepID=A0ABZ3C2T8_9GAMM|nr:ATP-binding protein [Ignatzschineria larvae]